MHRGHATVGSDHVIGADRNKGCKKKKDFSLIFFFLSVSGWGRPVGDTDTGCGLKSLKWNSPDLKRISFDGVWCWKALKCLTEGCADGFCLSVMESATCEWNSTSVSPCLTAHGIPEMQPCFPNHNSQTRLPSCLPPSTMMESDISMQRIRS